MLCSATRARDVRHGGADAPASDAPRCAPSRAPCQALRGSGRPDALHRRPAMHSQQRQIQARPRFHIAESCHPCEHAWLRLNGVVCGQAHLAVVPARRCCENGSRALGHPWCIDLARLPRWTLCLSSSAALLVPLTVIHCANCHPCKLTLCDEYIFRQTP